MKFEKKNTLRTGSPRTDSPTVGLSELAGLCLHSTADGRQCRMPRWEAHAYLCLFHARQEQQTLNLDRVGAEFRSLPGEFNTAGGLNNALGRLLALVANNRIPPRNAATLAYIGQLLLRTLDGVRQETLVVNDLAAHSPMDRESLDASG